MTTVTDDLAKHLERFGLSSFRPGQQQVIETVLAGQDCLCIMPTGGGKSLCYQLPAVAREGVTLVVSPLIALMKDQVDGLHERGIPATFINSSLSPGEQRERIDDMVAERYPLVYIAPERLRSGRFLDAVSEANIQLLAIDEAHCVSEWGHDFRPDYARLGEFRERMGRPQTIALTATATPTVRQDVISLLKLDSPGTFITGFARPNLEFEVNHAPNQKEKDRRLLELIREASGPAIVYASTRKRCEEIVETIANRSAASVGLYHAGLAPDERRAIQETFMNGDLDVIVATNAFGMGIDKADLRLVAHYNMPGSLEAYYQEAGRAGRDGKPSKVVLLFSYADRFVQEFFIENNYPSRKTVKAVYDFLRQQPNDPVEITQQELKERISLSVGGEGVGAAEKVLDKSGAIKRLDSQQNRASVWIETDAVPLVDLLPRGSKTQRTVMQAIDTIVGGRRFERVTFSLSQLLAMTELDREALKRALRELTKLRQFDYVPPFRGRAIHVLDRDAAFATLDIDFDELKRRKDNELEKLNLVMRYAYSQRCRQREVLDYFGDPTSASCGCCDNCRSRGAGATFDEYLRCDVDEALLKVIRMILSGVARSRERYGKQVVAQMLCGSQSAKMAKFRLDRLSTYGLLSHLKQTEVATLIDELVRLQLIEQVDIDRFRPIVKLSKAGYEVMSGSSSFQNSLQLPKELSRKLGLGSPRRAATPESSGSGEADGANGGDSSGDSAAELPPIPADVYQRLKNWRSDTARTMGVAPFRVLHNATLERIARRQPGSLDELESVGGVGPQTVATWGEQIVAAVSQETPPSSLPPSGQVASEATAQVDELVAAAPLEESSEPPPPSEFDSLMEFDDAASYRDDELPAVADELSAAGDESPPVDEPSMFAFDQEPMTASADTADDQPVYYWTWRLLHDGYSSDECRQIRGLSERQMTAQLVEAARAGLPVEAAWVLGEETIAALDQLLENGKLERLPNAAVSEAKLDLEQAELYLATRTWTAE